MGWEDNDFDWMVDEGVSSNESYVPGLESNTGYTPGQTDSTYDSWTGGSTLPWGQSNTDNMTAPSWDGTSPNYASTFDGINIPGMQTGTGETWNAPGAGSIKNTLASIFSGAQNNPALVGKGLAAVMEGVQNKKKAAAMQQIASNSALDPFGSQRGFYQQQAQQAVTNPYDSPIVKAQVAQMQNAQNIKDAAAGRRSNSLTSSPAVMAEMAKIAQQYQAQMAQQGGAGFGPNGAAISSALTSGANAGINGYTSPLLALLGNTRQSTANQSALQKFSSGSN